MEKLIVSNFLNIKHIELELGKINILIGPQVQGKSVIAKLVYFFNQFWFYYRQSLLYLQNQNEFNDFILSIFKKIFPEYTWINQQFKISYFIEGYEIILNNSSDKKRELEIKYSENLVKVRQEIHTVFFEDIPESQKENSIYLEIIQGFLKRKGLLNYLISKFVPNIQESLNLDRTLIFIPSNRSFFCFLKENIFEFLEKFEYDYFIKAFGRLYNDEIKYKYVTRNDNLKSTKFDLESIDNISFNILKGQYAYEQQLDFICSKDGRKIRLNDASSGQQEVLPIIVLLSAFGLADDNCFFFIEEPEAHLFPAAQNDIVNLMSLIFNITEKRHSFFITTHSPYILTAFNTLIQAGNTYKKIIAENREHQLPELFKIVPENQMLDIKDIRVYSLENGKIENIIEEEFQVIDANIIDDISNFTGEQLDKLLDLKYSHE
jgi:predicted ATPase